MKKRKDYGSYFNKIEIGVMILACWLGIVPINARPIFTINIFIMAIVEIVIKLKDTDALK
ncbi:MAG: hypothetical protein HFJ36_06280 [Clostridia bacterium]|nr:hypothetical protein [Clostridia bacterium]